MDEAVRVAQLATELATRPYDHRAVAATAGALVLAVREERRSGNGLDSLMQEFSLSSQEGIALLCLAEALLRIPDPATADHLIRETLARGDWQAHLGHSPSLFVNAAAWGLLLTGRLTATASAAGLGGALSRALARGGEPLLRRVFAHAVELLGERFVMGEDIATALSRSREAAARGYRHSFDMLGEAALTATDAAGYFTAYAAAIDAVGRTAAGAGVRAGPGVSVKLSALHPRYQPSQRDRVLAELQPRLAALAANARRWNIGLSIDAEECERLELSLDLLETLLHDPLLDGWDGLGFVVQAYQKRAPAVVEHVIALARSRGRRLLLRLVKGAYWDSEIKRAQSEGLDSYPVFTRKTHTDLCYLVCAGRLLDAADVLLPQFATHNAHTVAAVARMASERGVAEYEFQALHGMGEALYDRVLATPGLARPVRIYAPVGSHRTLLPYLVRRLLENGANTSFVHRLVDDRVALDELVADPLTRLAREGGDAHPAIPLPLGLFGDSRVNSRGTDLSDPETQERLAADIAASRAASWDAGPMLAREGEEGARASAAEAAIVNPARPWESIGRVRAASGADIASALAAAREYASLWAATPASRRAELLEGAALAIEADQAVLFALLVREAGKTWGNALGEIREAVDFLRYYAAGLRAGKRSLPLRPALPVACISPWNFPLAIFVGQVAAALAAGFPVLAKPAEQTPAVAARAVTLLRRAGIPVPAVQLLPGAGETVGRALVESDAVGGVLFTGSSAVAREIDAALAARSGAAELPFLVAETGGINAMVVDSSALPEQVVRDVLAGGFDSAGQRCSALRLLCLQEEIAEPTLAALDAALGELRLGDPADFGNDIGPLIDTAAMAAVETHLAAMAAAGHGVRRSSWPLPAKGSFALPALVEIAAPQDIPGEIFGPVVHVLRFEAGRLDALIEAINALGYGLTFAVHSRIDETIARLVAGVRAGNCYVNRNPIGAVVGVQPFGGEGLSGTGPKAGGPLLLPALMNDPDPDWQGLGFAPAPELANALLAPLFALVAWAEEGGDREFAAYCRRLGERSPLGRELALPGPTGESNRLRWAPRGNALCAGPAQADALRQLAACLATGNSPLAAAPAAWPASLPAVVRDAIRPGDAAPAVVLLADAADAGPWRRATACADGPRIAVVGVGSDPDAVPLYRLLCERVLTVNTAAAGGNAALMGLAS